MSILPHLPHEPTSDQREAINKLDSFVDGCDSLFILRGFAGTGKTTLIGATIKAMKQKNRRTILMAPTGRAAKVMGNYSGQMATTIHRRVYKIEQSGGGFFLELGMNPFEKALFIVDEASMISTKNEGESGFASRHLLDDLFEFTLSKPGCQLILVGDPGQLPPVKQLRSPALDRSFLQARYDFDSVLGTLRQVVRQAEGSEVLRFATGIRQMMLEKITRLPEIEDEQVFNVGGAEVQELIDSAYQDFGEHGVIVVTRSNKRAIMFNEQIRRVLLWREADIEASDQMMVVKNSYNWLDPKKQPGFLANGDLVEIDSVRNREERYGFEFADVNFTLNDYPDVSVEVKANLSSINIPSASIAYAELKRMRMAIAEEAADNGIYTDEVFWLKNPYWNAVQLKHAYAFTCHKSQGGQWPCVFIDTSFLRNVSELEDLRWLYTAVTRATEKLYLINFHPEYEAENAKTNF